MNIADSGWLPTAFATYPAIPNANKIPAFVTVLPHFCEKPLIEEITPFAEAPSLNWIKSTASLTNISTSPFCIPEKLVAIKVNTYKTIRFFPPKINKITYRMIETIWLNASTFCPVLNIFRQRGINTIIETIVPTDTVPM